MSSNSIPVPAAWLAIYLPVWKNLHTGKIPYSNLGAANSSSCPRNYSRAFTAWFTWMSVSEGVCCNFWVQINGRKFQPQESRIDLQGRQSPWGLVYLVPTPTDLHIWVTSVASVQLSMHVCSTVCYTAIGSCCNVSSGCLSAWINL